MQKYTYLVINKLKSNVFPILLVLISIFLCVKNYTPGTFLTGWDTLHPEFNYREYWKRMIGGAWQEHQGLGAVASQSHASEIPRVLILMLLDIFLPTSGIRYAYAFLMLILGPLGVFYFVRKGVFDDKKGVIVETASFCAGVFYLLNLVTVQHFYIPLEMFLTHYGYLGFFMLSIVNLLKEWSKKNLLVFSLVAFLMAPQAHTSTLFYALIANMLGFFVVYWVLSKSKLELIKRYFQIFVALITINAFWLLPNLYFAVNHGGEVQESKIHSLFNQEAFLQNQAYGNIKDMALGKGFLFNWGEHKGNLEFGYLLDEWQVHHAQPNVLTLGYVLFFCSIAGLLVAILYRKKEMLSVVGMLLVSMFFLFNLNPPTGFIYKFLQDNVPLFGDAFRFPFTKFSISLVFSYAVLFGFFVFGLVSAVSKLLKFPTQRVVGIFCSIVTLLLLTCLSFWVSPMFKGGLISPSMRVNIPDRYFELFDYLDKQEGFGRVANLPIHTFWGWVYHNWNDNTKLGYQGAGFLWFGIKQPLMDREFDRWNIINQEYYKDMTVAVYSRDIVLFESVLEKYKIRWILHDESVIAPGNDQRILFAEEIKNLLGSSENIVTSRDFGKGLVLYEYNPGKQYSLKEFVSGMKIQQSRSYVFGGVEEFSEELSPEFITATEDKTSFLSNSESSLYLGTKKDVYVPCFVYARIEDGNTWLRFEDTLHVDPIHFEYEIPNTSKISGVLLIDGEVISYSDLGAEYKKIGYMYIPLFRSLEYRIYDVPQNDDKNDASNLSADLEVCSDIGRWSSYSVSRRDKGFTLSSKNADACLTVNLSKVIPQVDFVEGLLVGLEVGGTFDEHPCIFNQKTTLCENQSLSKGLSYLPLVQSADSYSLRFYSRALGSIFESTQTYDSVVLSVQKSLLSGEITVPEVFVDTSLSTPLKQTLDFLKVAGFGGPAGTLVSNSRYCKSGERYRADTPFGNSRFYLTSDQEICDTFPFPLARHSTGHVLEIQARNVRGVPLRICLTNEYSKRCDKYIELPSEKVMSTHFYLIPPMGEDTRGYVVNISNLAFADLPSENELGYIGLTPISYNFIKNTRFEENLADAGEVFVYNESFENGWLAFCGLRRCKAEHVMVNGWANGWIFEDIKNDQQIPKVLFWPQFLEYFGFVLILCYLGYFSWDLFAKRSN